MKFLIDAQLPQQMALWLQAAGYDVTHTRDLPNENRTTDQEVCDIALRESRIVVTKDADFVDSHLLKGIPPKLLLISTGNISNRELQTILIASIEDIVRQFTTSAFLELGHLGLIVRG